MSERLNKATICSVVFLDILDLSGKPVVEQIRDKALFNGIIDEAIRDIAQQDRLLADIGDGKALVLYGAPEAALFIAMMIRDAIVEHNKVSDDKFFMRAGIGIGPVRTGSDINDLPYVEGDGVNVAERVKNLAGPNQILVSRAYHDITSGLTDEIAGLFFPFQGEREVYSIRPAEEEPFVPESAAEPPADVPLLSRLLNNEDTPRYGLWGSVALGAIVMLVGGFMLISSLWHPDLGVVIADSKPAAPAIDLQTVSEPGHPTQQLAAPDTYETLPDLAESAGPGPVMTTAATEPITAQPLAIESVTAQPVTTTTETDTAMDLFESDSSAGIEEAEPENQEIVPQEEVKKVAAAPAARRGPAVEERPLPSGGVRPKTIWDTFRESFKQGSTEHVCTQAEIALNQCK